MRSSPVVVTLAFAVILAAYVPENSSHAESAALRVSRDTIVKIADAPRHPNGGTLVEEITIGSVAGPAEYNFGTVAEILPAQNGAVWSREVRLVATEAIRLFDSAGKYVRHVGRRGQGPGEYDRSTVGPAQLLDGRIAVVDAPANRLLIFDQNGRSLATNPLSVKFSAPRELIGGTDGLLYLSFDLPRPRVPNATPGFPPVAWLRLTAAGTVVDTILPPELPVPLPSNSIAPQSAAARGRARTITAPYQARTQWSWNPAGFMVTAVTSRYAIDLRIPGGLREVGQLQPGSAAIPRLWKEGDMVVSIRREVPVVTLSADERSYHATRLRIEASANGAAGAAPTVPRVKQPIRGFFIGLEGRIWVELSQPSTAVRGVAGANEVQWREPMVFDIYEPTGEYVGQVRMPNDERPVAVRGDIVWTRPIDSDGVNFLRRYRISWR